LNGTTEAGKSWPKSSAAPFLAIAALLRFTGVSPDVLGLQDNVCTPPAQCRCHEALLHSSLHEFVRNRQETEGRAARIGTILGEIDGLQFLSARNVVDAMLMELEKIKRE